MNARPASPAKATKRFTTPAWGRQVVAAGASLGLNAALLACLGCWSVGSERVADLSVHPTPLRVIDREKEPLQNGPSAAQVTVSVSPPPAQLPELPNIPLAALPPLEQPATVLPAIRIAPPSFDSPAILIPRTAPPAPAKIGSPTVADGGGATRKAALIRPPDLSLYYPYRARLENLTGRTLIRVRVDASGRVLDSQIVSSVPSGVFEAAANRVAQTLQFQPALENGRPVSTELAVDIEWRLQE